MVRPSFRKHTVEDEPGKGLVVCEKVTEPLVCVNAWFQLPDLM